MSKVTYVNFKTLNEIKNSNEIKKGYAYIAFLELEQDYIIFENDLNLLQGVQLKPPNHSS